MTDIEDKTNDNLDDYESETTEPKVKSEQLEYVEIIYASLRSANHEKGGFSFQDIKALSAANTTLCAYFGEDEIGVATSAENKALDVFMKCCEFQQTKGVFTFEGSLLLIKALEKLTDTLHEHKTPADKIATLRKKNAENRTHKSSKKQVK